MAAIRSQTASAPAASSDAQVELGQRGVTLAGEDQGQGDGPVEEVGAASLTGPLGRTGDVEHVVEELEGEADLAAEGLEGARLLARLPVWAIRQAHSNRRAVFSSQRRR